MPTDTAMASLSLRAYALGLLAFMLIKVLAPGYFSRQDTKTPVKIGIIAMALNMVFNIALVVPFHYLWQIGHVGLALATSLSAFVNAGLLYRGLRRKGVFKPLPGWMSYILRLLVANVMMGLVLYFVLRYIGNWSVLAVDERILYMAGVCTCGLCVYIAGLLLMGMKLRDFKPNLA